MIKSAPDRITFLPLIEKHYADVDGRAVHYRACGSGPNVIMLHDSPRSSRLHLDTMRQLGRRFRVHCLDTPGYGNSDPIGRPEATIEDFAVLLGDTLELLGLSRAPLYATHTSAKIALAYAARGTSTPLLILDGLSIPDTPPSEEFIASYLRPFEPDASGAYLAREWSHVRDMLRWFPWFDARPKTRILMDAPTPEWLGDYVIDLFAAGPNYADAYAAALRHSPMRDLLRCTVPTIVAAREDDVLYSFLDRVPVSSNPNLTVERVAPSRAVWLAWLGDRLHSGCEQQIPPLLSVPAGLARKRAAYVRGTNGHIRHFCAGPSNEVPLVILGTPTTRHALLWQEALSEARGSIVPEFPGFGESDPLPHSTIDGVADWLAQFLDWIGVKVADILGVGLASGVAAKFAGRHPARVRALALDGLPPVDPGAARAMADSLCPAYQFDPVAGVHLHRIWHILRDSEVQWPWFDPSLAAARTLPPLFDPAGLHIALTEILKQPERYGDAALAVLRDVSGLARYSEVTARTLLFTHPTDPAYSGSDVVADSMSAAQRTERPESISAAAEQLLQFLDGGNS